jgi:hypothetical protein
MDRDVRRIENYKYRIAVDEWLIRKNSLQAPGYYPYPIQLDPVLCAAIADATRPAPALYPSRPVPTLGPMAARPDDPDQSDRARLDRGI